MRRYLPDWGFNPLLPGITWVDLVFPFFLFVLGAALPFAFERRLNSQKPFWRVSGHILERTALLVFFAIFVQHIRPYHLSENIWGSEIAYKAWALGIVGFVILFIIYLRAPQKMARLVKDQLKNTGLGRSFEFSDFYEISRWFGV